MGEALQGLRRICAEVRFLGSYPRAYQVLPAGWVEPASAAAGPEPVPPGTADADFADSAAWLARVRAGDLG